MERITIKLIALLILLFRRMFVYTGEETFVPQFDELIGVSLV